MPGLELYGVVPGRLGGVRLHAGGEGPLLAVQAELAHRAKLGEERVPLIASRQALRILCLCCGLGGRHSYVGGLLGIFRRYVLTAA